MMYEIKAKVELSEYEETVIPDELIREQIVQELAKSLKDKIILYTRFNPLTKKIEYSSELIFSNK